MDAGAKTVVDKIFADQSLSVENFQRRTSNAKLLGRNGSSLDFSQGSDSSNLLLHSLTQHLEPRATALGFQSSAAWSHRLSGSSSQAVAESLTSHISQLDCKAVSSLERGYEERSHVSWDAMTDGRVTYSCIGSECTSACQPSSPGSNQCDWPGVRGVSQLFEVVDSKGGRDVGRTHDASTLRHASSGAGVVYSRLPSVPVNVQAREGDARRLASTPVHRLCSLPRAQAPMCDGSVQITLGTPNGTVSMPAGLAGTCEGSYLQQCSLSERSFSREAAVRIDHSDRPSSPQMCHQEGCGDSQSIGCIASRRCCGCGATTGPCRPSCRSLPLADRPTCSNPTKTMHYHQEVCCEARECSRSIQTGAVSGLEEQTHESRGCPRYQNTIANGARLECPELFPGASQSGTGGGGVECRIHEPPWTRPPQDVDCALRTTHQGGISRSIERSQGVARASRITNQDGISRSSQRLQGVNCASCSTHQGEITHLSERGAAVSEGLELQDLLGYWHEEQASHRAHLGENVLGHSIPYSNTLSKSRTSRLLKFMATGTYVPQTSETNSKQQSRRASEDCMLSLTIHAMDAGVDLKLV